MSGLIGGLIASFLFSLVVAAVKRKRRTGEFEAAAYFGPIAKFFFGGTAVACIGIVAFVAYVDMLGNPTATWPVYVIVGVVALLAIGTFYDAFVRRVDWAETHVRFSKWNGTRTIAWADITSLQIKETLQYTRIGFRDGSGFAISELMDGYDSFVRAATYRRIKLTKNGRSVEH